DDVEDLPTLTTLIATGEFTRVVLLSGVAADSPSASAAELLAHEVGIVKVAVAATRAPKLYFVTRDSQRVTADDAVSGADGARLWGLARTIAEEYPEAFGAVIDLDAGVEFAE